MKKIISYLLIALLMPLFAVAQSPVGRLPKTVVADVLAQMPSKNVTIYNNMMQDLLSSGDEGLTLLTDGMTPSGDNTAVSFAIGGLSNYVTTTGKEVERKSVEKALLKALDKTADRELKAFFIRQLQIAGKDDAIATLKKYATTTALSQEAVSALTAINSPAAKAAVESLMEKIPHKTVAALAAANLVLTSQEPLLLSWLGSNDVSLQKTTLFALSRLGSAASIPALRKAAEAVNYTYEPTRATDSYLYLLRRFPDTVELNKLLNSNDANIRTAAIEIIADTQGKAVLSATLKAMADNDRPYRNAALTAAAPYADAKFYKSLTAKLSKVSVEAGIDILNYLGTQQVKASTKTIIKYLKAKDNGQRTAAIHALTRINDPRGATALITQLKGDDSEQIALVKEALSWYKTDLSNELLTALPTVSEKGKVAIIQLLGAKRVTQSVTSILNLTTQTGIVGDAAYQALSNVVTVKELDKLCTLLESGNQSAPLQQAIGAALTQMPAQEALATIQSKMAGKESLYYPTLNYIATPTTFNIIKTGIANGDPAAITAALTWDGFEASKTLLNLFKKDGNKQALTSYINLLKKTKYNDTQKLIYLREALEVAQTAAQKNALLTEIGKCNTFNALLLAGKYLNDAGTCHAAGTALMNIALKDKTYTFWGPEEKALLEQFLVVRGGGDAPYDKAAIQKYLAESPKEVGFNAIFNGKNLSGWKGLVEDPIYRSKLKPAELKAAQIKADEIMRTGWEVRDGVLYFTGKGSNLCTEKQYGDIEMYVDWKIQPQGDAGIYLRGAPQVQIWDTCRHEVGAEVGSGGLYNNNINRSKPLVVADNAVGEWNTFYIKMVGERVTVLLNGITVVDNVILENYWDRKRPIFPVEQLELQAHGTEVAYRDIYVKELPKVEPLTLNAKEKAEGFKLLFDGVSMNQWIGNTQDYVAEAGTITLNPGNKGGGNLYTKDEYTDFVFRFEFVLTPAANNGLGIRTPLTGDAAYVGMCELQILDSESPVYKDLEIYQYHGSAYGIIPAKRGFLKPIGEWNSEEVVVNGSHVKVTLNGTVILDGDLYEASKNGTMDHKEHPGLHNKKGHIGFLGHGSPVQFRNIRIKELNQ